MTPSVGLIISGGQTGVDRAALDVAVELGIPYAGWCPRGGWAEDFPNPPGLLTAYPGLKETPTHDPAERTEWNVRDSDAVLILTRREAESAGSDLAERFAEGTGRVSAVVDALAPDAEGRARELIASLPSRGRLGIGGPRESEAAGIYEQAHRLLSSVLST